MSWNLAREVFTKFGFTIWITGLKYLRGKKHDIMRE